ncbi:MAG: PAS domain S-box protein, partial [Methanomicrobiales archaeon]|nr:PAS domain S-box protein [Methanomicrobiales archaeon]
MSDAPRLLYVDDEPGLLSIGKLFLEREGAFTVDTLTSASEALTLLNTQQYDAIISDFQMPEIDGITFLKRLKASGNTTPFIIFTGRGREEVVIEALNEGADFYIQKGGEPRAQFAELANKIRYAITRRQVEDDLSESQTQTAEIIDFLPDATFAISTDGEVIAWNRAMEIMTGVHKKNILNKGNYEYSLPFYGERRPILIDLVLNHDEITSGKYPFIRKEGDKIASEIFISHFHDNLGAYLWFTASPLYNSQGVLSGAIESIRDITEQKRAEEALGESEERYRHVVEDQTEFISRFLPDGTHIFVNDAYCRYFGVAREKILGHRFRPVIHSADKKAVDDFFATLTIRNPVGSIDQRIIMHGGEIRWQRWSERAIFDPDGNVVQYQSVGRDITEQKQAEEELCKKNEELQASYEQIAAAEEELRANLETMTGQERELRESEEKFRTLFENAGDAILIMDRTVFLDCNRRTNEMYQCTRDQIIGHTPGEFSPERQPDGQLSAEKMKKKIDAAFLGENRFFEWVHIHQDGTQFIVEVSLNRVMVQGTYYLQAIVRDITDRKQNDDQTAQMSYLKEELLGTGDLQGQLKLVSDSCIRIFGADFARIWLIKEGDLCGKGCRHASVSTGPEVCRNRTQCLHLMASSGRYTHIDGSHQRVPFGCYKIGRVASGDDPFFITNDVIHDKRVHDHAWAQSCGLVSFAGFRLISQEKRTVGVLALFRDRAIPAREEKLLVDLANTLSQVIISGLAEDALLRKNEELNASYEQIAAAEEELRGNLDEMTRAEQVLRENEERYRQFFKTTLDCVFITTHDGQWVDCNDALVDVFGYESREEVFSVPVSSFYAHPEERFEFLKIVEREGYVKEHPLQFKKKDGTVLDGLITIVPQKNHDGSPKGFIGTVHDITGKKRRHASLSTFEPFNQGRVEDLPDSIVVYGPADGEVLYVNQAAVKTLGYDAETMIGTSLLSYVAEECRDDVAAKMLERYEMGGLPIYETDLLTRDGLRKLVIVKGTKVLFHNRPATLLLLIDISRRKTLEDELTARAEELSRVSTAFRQTNKKLMLLSSITRHDI